MGIDRLTEALAALELIDPDTLSDSDLHEVVAAVEKARDRLAMTAGRLTAAWDGRRVWASNQSLSAKQRLANTKTCDVRTARRELRRARKLATMPAHRGSDSRRLALARSVRCAGLEPTPANVARCSPNKKPSWYRRCWRCAIPDAVKAIEYWIMPRQRRSRRTRIARPQDCSVLVTYRRPVGTRRRLGCDLGHDRARRARTPDGRDATSPTRRPASNAAHPSAARWRSW